MMNEIIRKFFSDIPTEKDYSQEKVFYPVADDEKIKEVEAVFSIKFPQDYINFLLTTNGYDGKLGLSHVALIQIEQIEKWTHSYGGETYPWTIVIGTDGANEMFVIDRRTAPLQFGILPYIGDGDDFISLGNTFEEFVQHLYNNDFWNHINNGERNGI